MSTSEKVVVTCALTGVLTSPDQFPVPVTPEQMAESAKGAFDAGATMVHCHFRNQEPGLGYLPESYLKVAQKGWAGMQREFVEDAQGGGVNFKGTVSVAGLGGNPYRDGSYEYYLSEKVVTNDPKGIGALILAATEMEAAAKWYKKSKLSMKKK